MKGLRVGLLAVALIASFAVLGFVFWRWYLAPKAGLGTAQTFLSALADGSPSACRGAYDLMPDAWRAAHSAQAFEDGVRPLVAGLRGTTPRVEKRDMLPSLARITARLDAERTASVTARKIDGRWRVVHARVHGDELKAE